MTNSGKRFAQALADLLYDERFRSRTHNIVWTKVAEEVGIDYETLRKALTRERQPSEKLLTRVAKHFDVSPEYFLEYRLQQAAELFDIRVAGPDAAIRNLRVVEDAGLLA